MAEISLADKYKVVQQLQEDLERGHADLSKKQEQLQKDYDSYGSPHFLSKIDKCINAADANSLNQSAMSERLTSQAEGIQRMYEHILEMMKGLKNAIESDIEERTKTTKMLAGMAQNGGQFEVVVNKMDWLADKLAVLSDLSTPGFLESTIPDGD